MSLLIYSHVISTILAIIFLVIMSLVWYKLSFNKRVIINFIKGTLLTFVITSFFWVTVLQQMLSVKIIRPDTFILQFSGTTLDKVVNSALANDLDFSCSVSIGIIGLFSLIIGSFLLKRADKFFITIYLFALITLLMSTHLFPWSLIQKTPLNIIQFPWRITEFTSLFLALLFVLIVRRFSLLNLKYVILITLLISMLGLTTSNLFIQEKTLDINKPYLNNEDFVNISKQINTKDYYPQKSSSDWIRINPNQWGDLIKHSIYNKDYFVNNKKVNEKTHYHETRVSIDLDYSGHSYELNTPILYYDGTIAKVDGNVVPIKQSNRGTIIVDIPKHSKHLELSNHYTTLSKIAAFISLLSLILILIFEIYKKLFRIK